MQETSRNLMNAGMPAVNLPPIALDRFCQMMGISPVTAWRFQRRGWLRTFLISNRRYVLAGDIQEFNRRIASGEFAGIPSTPRLHTSRQGNAIASSRFRRGKPAQHHKKGGEKENEEFI
jgi:hypothetical protein